jgi:hypothetical protein
VRILEPMMAPDEREALLRSADTLKSTLERSRDASSQDARREKQQQIS